MIIKKDQYSLYKGDCLEVMDKLIEEGIKVDAIICDPPYGITACKWDSIIPFDDMWKRLNKLIKPNRAICLFGSEPFSSALRMSNIKNYKYDWIWEKSQGSNFMSVKYQPYKVHEIISVFNKHHYNPQMTVGTPYISGKGTNSETTGSFTKIQTKNNGTRYPRSVQKFSQRRTTSMHPTQKPTELMEYLIKTYTKEGDLILDFTMGSGSTGVARLNTNRKFIGIELDDKYFDIAKDRLYNNK